MKEIRNFDIPEHTSNVDSNVSISVTPTINPSTVLPPPTSLLIASGVQTSMSPTHSPTFDGIFRQPITTLFSYQSTNPSHDHGMDDS